MAEARERTLRDVAIGDTATVRRLNGEGAIKRHIMDMGITKGTSVFVRKVAPLGDPIEVTVRGYELSPSETGRRCGFLWHSILSRLLGLTCKSTLRPNHHANLEHHKNPR